MVGHRCVEAMPWEKVNCMLLRASKDGDLEGIRKALDGGANINTRLPPFIRASPDANDFGYDSKPMDSEQLNPFALSLTPLMHAAQEGHTEAVALLLRRGAQVNLHEQDGMQALHFAAASASIECFRMLLGAGANPMAKDVFGRGALACVPMSQIAASPSRQDWLQLFKEAKCWSATVSQAKVWAYKAEKSGCEASPAEEASESSNATATLTTEGECEEALETSRTATNLSVEQDIEEVSEPSNAAATLSTERELEEGKRIRYNSNNLQFVSFEAPKSINLRGNTFAIVHLPLYSLQGRTRGAIGVVAVAFAAVAVVAVAAAVAAVAVVAAARGLHWWYEKLF